MELEVLVATMQQTDFALTEKMNLCQNAVIANQCGRWGYEERISENLCIRMISSDTRGVGINRNLALGLARADILLFADDDITYYDGALQGVVEAFKELPDADVIFFGMDMTRNGKVSDKRRNRIQRVHIWNSLRYGTARMAIRREAVIKNRLAFSVLFGGGCCYGSGEDTIFIRDCFRAGLRVYSHDYVLGTCAQDSSTWFSGYNDKYFFDRGAMVACAFPNLKHVLKWHFAIKSRRKTGVSLKRIIALMNRGIKAFLTLCVWEEENY